MGEFLPEPTAAVAMTPLPNGGPFPVASESSDKAGVRALGLRPRDDPLLAGSKDGA